ncbi:MAG TPA: hypothetical protein DCO72_02900 [Ruminococcus sp.]|jgi:hypothetical protein|nr:hypothetical protein [Ruminococcus sp.]
MNQYQNAPEIQKFLQDAQAETKHSGEVCKLPTFQEFWEEHYSASEIPFSERQFLEDAEVMLAHNQLDYYQELTSYRSGISFIVRPVKKVIRKLNAFLFLPLVNAQNNVNLMTAKLFLHMRSYVNQDHAERKFYELRTKELEQKLDAQQEIIRTLSEEIAILKERLDDYEGGQE